MIYKSINTINNKRMQSVFVKVALLFIVALFIVSCQPSIRFASKSEKVEKKGGTELSRKKDIEIEKLNRDKNLEEFKTGKSQTDDLIEEAESWLGVPYKYGGETKLGADCSGFVQTVYQTVGIKLPRTSSQQFKSANLVEFADKKAGDLVFFRNKGVVNHVGIYLGKGYMIHASTSSGVITQSIHDSYFINRIAGVGRVIP